MSRLLREIVKIGKPYIVALFIGGVLVIASVFALAVADGEGPFDNDKGHWLIVKPVDEDALTGDEEIISYDDERINDVSILQSTLRESARTNEGMSVELSKAEVEAYAEATQTIERAPDEPSAEPGFLIEYEGEVFRVWVQSLN